jgi:hypothetical protein
MFWQEHTPPHFHALYGEFEALIDIRTLEVIRALSREERYHWSWNGQLSTEAN